MLEVSALGAGASMGNLEGEESSEHHHGGVVIQNAFHHLLGHNKTLTFCLVMSAMQAPLLLAIYYQTAVKPNMAQ